MLLIRASRPEHREHQLRLRLNEYREPTAKCVMRSMFPILAYIALNVTLAVVLPAFFIGQSTALGATVC